MNITEVFNQQKIKNIINFFFGPSKKEKHYIECIDQQFNKEYSLIDIISNLESRIEKLEEENLELTNELYRLENSLDARIDILFQELQSNGR